MISYTSLRPSMYSPLAKQARKLSPYEDQTCVYDSKDDVLATRWKELGFENLMKDMLEFPILTMSRHS